MELEQRNSLSTSQSYLPHLSTSINEESNIEQEQREKKDMIMLLCSKKITKPKRRKKEKCILRIQQFDPLFYPISEQQFYKLNGSFCIYIDPQCINDINQSRKVNVIQNYDTYLQANLTTSQCVKDFKVPIQLLEKSQNQEKYKFAQTLKDIQLILDQVSQNFKKILKCYSKKREELNQLNFDRSKYRKEQISKYIKEHMREEDFYFITEFGENYDFAQIDLSSISMSKPFLALLGIEEKDISQFFLHIGMADFVFLTKQEIFYGSIYDSYKNHDRNRFTLYKDFMFVTLDKLKIYCDLEIAILDLIYPPHLDYQCDYEPFQFNQSAIFKFNITSQHLKSLLDYRLHNKNDIEAEYFHSYTLEYSILSSIFLDKYYPPKENEPQLNQISNNQSKICKYKQII